MTHAAALADTLHVNVFSYEYVARMGRRVSVFIVLT